ncbi:MAG: hypothetical protein U0835_00210 [Isosphaeraceae bacterium]
MKQKVRMLKTQHGVHDGEIHPVAFVEGEEYEIGPNLLESFIDHGVVDMPGEKSQGDAPHNKAKAAAPSNKAK